MSQHDLMNLYAVHAREHESWRLDLADWEHGLGALKTRVLDCLKAIESFQSEIVLASETIEIVDMEIVENVMDLEDGAPNRSRIRAEARDHARVDSVHTSLQGRFESLAAAVKSLEDAIRWDA